MNRVLKSLLIMTVLTNSLTAEDKEKETQQSQGKKLSTDKQKASYGIGQQIGRGLRTQGIDVDLDVLVESIRDAVEDRPSKLSDEEIMSTMAKLQADRQKKKAEMAEENKKIGAKFLEENKKKPGVKVTKSGLQYKIITEGKGESPKENSRVKVHYQGTYIDGSEFDSSYKRKEPQVLSVGGVIPGWSEALQLMKPGAKWELAIPSDLAYGSRGRGGEQGIPGNSVLRFTVELIEVLDEKPKTNATGKNPPQGKSQGTKPEGKKGK